MQLLFLTHNFSSCHHKIRRFIILFLVLGHPSKLFLALFWLSWWYKTWSLRLCMFLFILLDNFLFFLLLLRFLINHFALWLILFILIVLYIVSVQLPIFLNYLFLIFFIIFLFKIRLLVSLLKHQLLFSHYKFAQLLLVCVIVLWVRALIKMQLTKIAVSWFVLMVQNYVFLLFGIFFIQLFSFITVQ